MQKIFLSLGMVSSVALLAEDILGMIFWPGYNPVTSYMSELFADEAPDVAVTRMLLYLSELCLVIFLITICIKLIKFYGIGIRIGFLILLLAAVGSAWGYGFFPVTMDFIFSFKNLVHVAITGCIVAATMAALFFLALGYLRQRDARRIGRFTMCIAILFLLFNAAHFCAILSGLPVLGLMERLVIYTFEVYVFGISWFYVFQRGNRRRTYHLSR